jgi:hypothetical protein
MATLDWSQCPAVESVPDRVLEFVTRVCVPKSLPTLVLFDHGTPKGRPTPCLPRTQSTRCSPRAGTCSARRAVGRC